MREGDWTDCCGNILEAIGLALLVEWAQTNPFWAAVTGSTFFGVMMVVVPLFLFTRRVVLNREMEAKQKMKWGMVVGYFIGLFTLISSILFGIVRGLFAVLGVVAFICIGIMPIIDYAYKSLLKQRERTRAKALVWELKDQMEQLNEQLGRDVISKEEYEQKKKSLENQLEQLKAHASKQNL